MRPLRTAIIGFGKIATDQHVPAIADSPRFELAGSVSRHGDGPAPHFVSHEELLRAAEGLEAVSITTPPGPRYAIARDCIAAGLHCMLEKPPTVTLGEIEELRRLAEDKGVTLFTTWHAQHNPAVTAAAALLQGKRIASMQITWHESVHKWHPGQQWIWEPGGFGVFDPGINAFSILTRIFPGALFVREGELSFPENAQTPIAGALVFGSPAADGPLRCSLDFRREEGEEWTMAIRTAEGRHVRLEAGGSRLVVDGREQPTEGPDEYPDLYRTFADLIDCRQSLVDVGPLRIVADALLVARRTVVEPVTV